MIFYTDDSNVKDWRDLTPDKIHAVKFEGKQYDKLHHGRWINGKCSVCEADAPYTYDGFWEETPYCPNCGSRMDLEDDEDE